MARHRPLIALLAACTALAAAAPAAAADAPIVVAVRPGQLALGPVSGSKGLIRVTVVDARGSGTGWTVTAVPRAQALGGASITAVDAWCGPRSTCTLPETSLHYPLQLAPSRQTAVFTARTKTGMGRVQLVLHVAGRSSPAGLLFRVRPD